MKKSYKLFLIVASIATIIILITVGKLHYEQGKLLNDYEEHLAVEQLFFNEEDEPQLPEVDPDFPLAPCTDPNQEEKDFTWEGDLQDNYQIPSTGDTSYTKDELNLIYAIVMQEGGSEYDSAVAVMSTIINRVNNPSKWSWAGNTIIDQITYPQQYCYSLDDLWIKYLNGNVPESVKQAVNDVLQYGPVYEYDCFRGYPLEGCEHIGGNWFYVG